MARGYLGYRKGLSIDLTGNTAQCGTSVPNCKKQFSNYTNVALASLLCTLGG